MALDLIQTVLEAERQGKVLEAEAEKSAEKIISDARIQCEIIRKASLEQAKSEAQLILSEAEYTASGMLKQAEKLAELREKKSIFETEKQYETAIKMVFEEILG